MPGKPAKVPHRDPRRLFLGETRSHVYFLYCAGFIKIGVTGNPRLRHAALTSMIPLPVTQILVMRGDQTVERELHSPVCG